MSSNIAFTQGLLGILIFFLLTTILLFILGFALFKLIVLIRRLELKRKLSKIDFDDFSGGAKGLNKKILFNSRGYPSIYLEKNETTGKTIIGFF